jgi:hypothetical protein
MASRADRSNAEILGLRALPKIPGRRHVELTVHGFRPGIVKSPRLSGIGLHRRLVQSATGLRKSTLMGKVMNQFLPSPRLAAREFSVPNNGWLVAALAGILLVTSLCQSELFAQNASPVPSPANQPASRIELSGIGYHIPSRMDRLSEDQPSESLDFVDAEHVLLTFNQKKLFQRLPGCPPGHEDRVMHAVILDIGRGKVVNEADWYLHDRRRYLWPLGSGEFLLRRWNDLYVVDSQLTEKLLLSSPKDLLWVSVTPDGSQIVVESLKDNIPAKDPNSKWTSSTHHPKYEAQFLDAKTLVSQRTIELSQVVDLTATSTGYADLVQKGDVWLLRFGSSPSQRRNLARVRSRSVPNVLASSNDSLLIGRCPAPDCDYSVTAFSVSGQRLWQQHWPGYRAFPTITYSKDNSRVAVGTLRVMSSNAGIASSDEDGIQVDVLQTDVFQEEIQVFSTGSGNPVLSVRVGPATFTGQNFALDPDGHRLALLQGSSLELIDLPPTAPDERLKMSALKIDRPDLYAVDSQGADAEPMDTVSEGAPERISPSPHAPATQDRVPADQPTSAAHEASDRDPPDPAAQTVPPVQASRGKNRLPEIEPN